MDTLEILTKGLGKPLASFLLKLWLGEPLGSMGTGLVDLASGRIQDFGKRREAARVFEGIADRMVHHLQPLFDEAHRRGQVNLEAVAHELGLMLEGQISAERLVARDLNPALLTRVFREARALPSGQFSAAEEALYNNALEKAARYVVEVASMLPRFEVAAVATQLQRLSYLQSGVEQMLEAVSRVEQMVAAAMPGDRFSRFEADYRQAVNRNVDRLELFGVDVEEPSRRYGLSVAYISLSLNEDSEEDEKDSGDDPRSGTAELVFDEYLQGAGRLLIRGNAGSGKSTLLKWAAWTASRLAEGAWSQAPLARVGRFDELQERTEVRATWRSRIPFLVRLRECKDGRLPTLDELTLHAARELGRPPEGWVRSVLSEGRALLLLDGVDEVPLNLRNRIREDVEQMVRTYDKCAFLLTTRPAAISGDWLKTLGFCTMDLNPLSPVDRDQLIERWHAAVARELEQMGRATNELVELARELQAKLRENSAIARLATNPLLAAAVCALHRQRNRRLPETQVELCEDLCKMLLHQREAETLNLSGFPAAYRELTYVQKKRIVQTLAHDMVLNGRSVLEKEDVLHKVGEALERMGRATADAESVLSGLIERSGMLRETSPGEIDFIHNTFKEYLAAEVFAERRDDGLLARNALDPAWQQVLIFTATKGEQQFVEKLIEQLLVTDEEGTATAPSRRRGGRKRVLPKHTRQRGIMALRLRAAALELRPELRQKIDALQQQLFPPATVAEAEVLAASGDAVVPFLRYEPSAPAQKVVACVRTLRLIDSPASKAALRAYAQDRRWKVAAELARVLPPLEIRIIRQALEKDDGLPWSIKMAIFDLGLSADPEVQQTFKRLRVLDLSFTRIQTLAHFTMFESLQNLRLDDTPVQDLKPLASLTSLKSLSLSGTLVHDLTPLASLTSLQYLDLRRTPVQDLTPLASLTSLQHLDLSGTPVQDLKPLASITSLQYLHLMGVRTQDLTPLAGLSSLHIFR